MTIAVPQGFRLTGVHSGVKRNASKLDLTLVVSDAPAVAAGVYTQNRVFAAPVAFNRARTPSANIRTVVVNSGNANACTGERGLADVREMAKATAAACATEEQQALVMSTGVIGSFLPMDKIIPGIKQAAESLGRGEESLLAAARGMMTTDTVHKLSGRTLHVGNGWIFENNNNSILSPDQLLDVRFTVEMNADAICQPTNQVNVVGDFIHPTTGVLTQVSDLSDGGSNPNSPNTGAAARSSSTFRGHRDDLAVTGFVDGGFTAQWNP